MVVDVVCKKLGTKNDNHTIEFGENERDIGCGSEWFCRKIRQKFVQFPSSPFFLQILPPPAQFLEIAPQFLTNGPELQQNSSCQ